MKKLLFMPLIMAVLVLGSCKRVPDTNENDISDELAEQLNTASSDKTIYYRFPSPEEILRYIHDEDLIFNEELINPLNNAALYIDSKGQSINLGIYISDLVYATIFRKASLASDYLEVVQRLSDALHINYIEEDEVIERVKNNFGNLDSLMGISRDSYNYMVDYLVETNNEKTLALISAGAYIEALYLIFNQVHDFSLDNPVLKKLLEQKYAFENLIKYMDEFQDIPQVADVITEMKNIQNTFNKVIFEKTEKGGFQKKGGELVLTGSEKKLVADKQTIMQLKRKIDELRNEFVQDI